MTARRRALSSQLVLKKLFGFEDSLKLTDLNLVLVNVLGFFVNEIKLENIYWFQRDQLIFAAQQIHSVNEMEFLPIRSGDHCPPFLAQTQEEPMQIRESVLAITKSLKADWESCEKIKEFKHEQNSYIIVPVIPRRIGQSPGMFIIKNSGGWKTSWIKRSKKLVQQVISRNIEEAFRFSKTKELTFIDDLTGLFNQRYLPIALDREITRSSRDDLKFSILFLDIDHFKLVNDKHGHIIGSKILGELGLFLRNNIRGTDVGFRYGGDEYLLVLSGTDPKDAQSVAERLRHSVANHYFVIGNKKYQITLSIGVATFPDHAGSRDQLINMADQAMYYGKHSGRNIVYVAS